MIVTARHFESEKNVSDVHGYSELDAITTRGLIQAKNLASNLRDYPNITSICYVPTLQAQRSAELLSKLMGIGMDKTPLTLLPFDMGVANGITNSDLERMYPHAYNSLEQFRNRVIDATKLELSNAESTYQLEERILQWWRNEGESRLNNKILIGSNSTLIMLTNFFRNCLPSSNNYMCFDIPNGAMRIWENVPRLDHSIIEDSYPDVSQIRIPTQYGYIQTSCYHSNWGMRSKICIVCPGYFGNNRLGPYSLFVKLAQVLSRNGVTTILLDYLGSGESSCVKRSFQSDLFSIEKAIDFYAKNKSVLLVGHSLGCALISTMCSKDQRINGIALAPLVTLKDLAENFLDPEQIVELIENDRIVRRGVEFDKSYIDSAEAEWTKNAQQLLAVVVAKNDQYSSYKFKAKNHFTIAGADHNFSENETYETMLRIVTEIAITDELETQLFSLDQPTQ